MGTAQHQGVGASVKSGTQVGFKKRGYRCLIKGATFHVLDQSRAWLKNDSHA